MAVKHNIQINTTIYKKNEWRMDEKKHTKMTKYLNCEETNKKKVLIH